MVSLASIGHIIRFISNRLYDTFVIIDHNNRLVIMNALTGKPRGMPVTIENHHSVTFDATDTIIVCSWYEVDPDTPHSKILITIVDTDGYCVAQHECPNISTVRHIYLNPEKTLLTITTIRKGPDLS